MPSFSLPLFYNYFVDMSNGEQSVKTFGHILFNKQDFVELVFFACNTCNTKTIVSIYYVFVWQLLQSYSCTSWNCVRDELGKYGWVCLEVHGFGLLKVSSQQTFCSVLLSSITDLCLVY